jgi:hypothetical protein
VVADFGQAASRPGALKRRSDLGHANGKWNLNVRSPGDGQRIAGTDTVGFRVNYGERGGGDSADDYVDQS